MILRGTTRARLVHWVPPVAWAAGIFTLSCITFPPQPPVMPQFDKIVHGLLYAILSLLLCRAFRGERGWRLPQAALWAFVLTILYGLTDELHQSFIPGRCMDAWDWVADLLGAAVVFLLLLWRGKRGRPSGPALPVHRARTHDR